MAQHRFLMRFFIPLFIGLVCAAQQPSAGKATDLKASDSTLLKATYFAGKPGPGILLLHQCNQTRTAWDGLAGSLAAAGFNVLTVDYRGFGESGGARDDQMTQEQRAKIIGEKWPSDIDAALKYLSSQPGVKRELIGVGGASCGVNQAVTTAHRHPEVKSLVLLSGDVEPEGRRFLRKSGNLPIFLAAADDDFEGFTTVLVEWLYELTSNAGNKFVRYPTGGHGNEMFAAHAELPAMIVEWFTNTLVKAPNKVYGTRPVSALARSFALLEEPGGPAKLAAMLTEARRADPKAQLFPEFAVNTIGYERLQSGDIKGALEMLQLNELAFPKSPNVFDSLADAYLAGGQKELALENARKALKLLGTDTIDSAQRQADLQESALRKIKQLSGEPK